MNRIVNSKPIRIAIAGLMACVLTALAASAAKAAPNTTSSSKVERHDEQAPGQPPARQPGGLRNGMLREHLEQKSRGESGNPSVEAGKGRARVEIVHTLEAAELAAAVEKAGGTVVDQSPGLALAIVPEGRLMQLEGTSGVLEARPPLAVGLVAAQSSPDASGLGMTGLMGGEATAKTRADAWHNAGYKGAGVKIGIVDWFDGGTWITASNYGDLPPGASGVFCRRAGVTCDIWAQGGEHGVAVAEVVRDMAPSAKMYLATAETVTDLRAAIDWFAANGVRIVTRSLAAYYDGAGNGTGPMADAVNYAVSKGITFFNAAGNSARDASGSGGYFRGKWSDTDGDRWMNFSGGDELMAFYCGMSLGLRWSDWSTNRTNYDLYVYDAWGTLLTKSTGNQSAGVAPIENIQCPDGVAYLAIWLYSSGNGTANDTFEYMVNLGEVEYPSSPYSATVPASDSASAGALSVGAIDPASGVTIGGYSSQGPTNDGRMKPNLTAASCVSSITYYPCFSGTSAATPVAAGAAALVLGRWTATTPAQMKTWLMNSSVVDRGVVGWDNVYGAGELILPTP